MAPAVGFPEGLRLEESEDPTPDDVAFVSARLYEFNREATGIADGKGLAFFLRDASGRIRAALIGHTWGGTCEISMLWLHESLRGGGCGRHLVERAESIARARGCTQILVASHSFQAPGFYAKLGFEPLFEVADYPRGHAEISLLKPLGPAA